MSEFRAIHGTVQLWRDGMCETIAGLYMFGAMPFLFVKLPSGHMSHLEPEGKLSNTRWTWFNVVLGEAYRLNTGVSVVCAIDIARETAKRLGVEQ